MPWINGKKRPCGARIKLAIKASVVTHFALMASGCCARGCARRACRLELELQVGVAMVDLTLPNLANISRLRHSALRGKPISQHCGRLFLRGGEGFHCSSMG